MIRNLRDVRDKTITSCYEDDFLISLEFLFPF